MGFHLYCVVPPGHLPPEDLRGIGEGAVQALDVVPVSLWCTEMERPPRVDLPEIRNHDAVVRRATSERVTPVPVRFGQWFPDRAALVQRISESAERHLMTLEVLAGCLEFGVRFLDPEPAGGQPRPSPSRADRTRAGGSGRGTGIGRSYLRFLAATRVRERDASLRGEALGRELEALLAERVVLSRVDRGRSEGELAEASHLVHRRDLHAYRETVERFRRRHTQIRIVTTGPWPPYSFAS